MNQKTGNRDEKTVAQLFAEALRFIPDGEVNFVIHPGFVEIQYRKKLDIHMNRVTLPFNAIMGLYAGVLQQQLQTPLQSTGNAGNTDGSRTDVSRTH